MLKNKILVITGGTGSFGNAVLKYFLNTHISEIRILSRDEKKQDEMRIALKNPKLKFFIGDVRDSASLVGAFKGANYVFHASALKQVPSCEFYPMEAVKTNVLGTQNVLDVASSSGVERVVFIPLMQWVFRRLWQRN
jgi:UDP-N-acetylglucosamine 4,6-dehydratase/5-epimerase